MARYLVPNGPSPTTAAQVAVTTGVAIKTLVQVAVPTTVPMRVVEWGVSFGLDPTGAAAVVPVKVELIETDVAATVTAHVASGLVKLDNAAFNAGDPTAGWISVGTAATGYTASAEGSITASRVLDVQHVAPTGSYLRTFAVPRDLQAGKFLRVRVTATTTAANAYAFIGVEVVA